ncbi:hypothetical protein BDV98DRAFT_567901 [Pterulicium gracile]|uniref:MYND-type domain-containing protein n=1 Tax=Pterulicium gracile TaxID=1884261 RepID=A0A5C3QLH1_9AGAR|nr:hypothetical protein BDV98DRAFT_567901 [Pterula gracilis]
MNPCIDGNVDNLPVIPKDRCVTCHVQQDGLKCCQKCRSAPYCSRECQVADWKDRKKAWCVHIQRVKFS